VVRALQHLRSSRALDALETVAHVVPKRLDYDEFFGRARRFPSNCRRDIVVAPASGFAPRLEAGPRAFFFTAVDFS